MLCLFYFLGFISIISTLCVIFQSNPIYALLYLIISFLSISGIFFVLGSFFSAALEVIIYAGAIMLLFVFVIMMLNVKVIIKNQEKKWTKFIVCIFPGIFSFILLSILIFEIFSLKNKSVVCSIINSKDIGISLFGPYLMIVELSSMLLLTMLVITYHLGNENRVKKLSKIAVIRKLSEFNKKGIENL